MEGITRREFLYMSAVLAGAAIAGPACVANIEPASLARPPSAEKKTDDLESMLQLLVDTAEREKWDPTYGANFLFVDKYGGRADFEGHKSGGATDWGIDHKMPVGIPLVPATPTNFIKTDYDDRRSLNAVLQPSHVKGPGFPPDYIYNLLHGHLSEVFVGELGKTYRPPWIMPALSQDTIFARSGATGNGFTFKPDMSPHLHFSLSKFYLKSRKKEKIDPEKYGPNKSRPVYWDGETILCMPKERRVYILELTLAKDNFEELLKWPQGNHEMHELRGNILEYHRQMGDVKGTKILDSVPFQNMRESLVKKILEAPLEERRAYVPGTEPYSLMLKIVGYSSMDQEPIILLPYPSPDLAKLQLGGKLKLYKVANR